MDPKNDKKLARYKGLFSDLPLPDDATDTDLVKLGTVWDKIESFITEDLADGFQIKDLYSLVVAVMSALELVFPGVSGEQLKKYAKYLVKRLVTELTDRNIIPSEIAFMLNFIPLGTIIDLISNIGKKGVIVNRLKSGDREKICENEWNKDTWVKDNWIL